MRNKILLITIVYIVLIACSNLLAHDHENIELVGSIYHYWGDANDVVVQGDYAYLALEGSGLGIVNISDPFNPEIVGSFDTLTSLRGITIRDTLVFITDYKCGLRIVDVSDVNNAVEISYFNSPVDTSGEGLEVDVSNELALVADGFRGMRVIDISDIRNPEEIGSFTSARRVTDVELIGDLAYIAGTGGLRILDVSDPSEPNEISFYDEGGTIFEVVISGDLAFVSRSNSIHVINTSDPHNPEEIGYYETSGGTGSISYFEERIYASDSDNGLLVLDVSDPTQPEELGSCESVSNVWGLDVRGDYVYIAAYLRGLCIVDVSDPSHPEVNSYCDSDRFAIGFCNDGGLGYLVDDESLRVIDISDPTTPTEISYLDTPGRSRKVSVVDTLVFIAQGDSGLRVIDVSDPEHPNEIGAYQTEGFANNIAVYDDLAYVTDDDLQIIDVSDPTNPRRVGMYNTRYANSVTVCGDLAYVTGYDNGLRIVDVSNPARPREIGHYGYGSPLMNLEDVVVLDNLAYIANWVNLLVVDVSDPRHPETVSSYENRGGICDVSIYNDLIYLAISHNGIEILDVSNLDSIVQVGYYNTPSRAKEITLSNELIYVADGTNLGIYRYGDQSIIRMDTNESPSEFYLYPAYPNPFNSTTTIRYSLPIPTHVSLEVYNLTGQRIISLFEGYRQAGFYTNTLTAIDLSSGLYFIRLEASNQISCNKVVIVK